MFSLFAVFWEWCFHWNDARVLCCLIKISVLTLLSVSSLLLIILLVCFCMKKLVSYSEEEEVYNYKVTPTRCTRGPGMVIAVSLHPWQYQSSKVVNERWTHTHTHTHAQALTHARTHTHTHTWHADACTGAYYITDEHLLSINTRNNMPNSTDINNSRFTSSPFCNSANNNKKAHERKTKMLWSKHGA